MAEAVEVPQSKDVGKGDISCEENKEFKVDGKVSELDKLTDLLAAVALTDDLTNKLKTLHCPFTWGLREEILNTSPYDIRMRLKEKEEELEGEEGPHMVLRDVGLQIAICYLEWREGDIQAAFERQCIADRLIEDCKDLTIIEGLKHITMSTLAYLKYESGKLAECEAIFKKITPFSEFDVCNKACVSGMRGIILMEYGIEGTREALSHIEEALKLVQSNAEWHFLYGKCLRRIRKVDSYNEIPEHKELKALEKAAEMSSCAGYYVFLAQAYRETAFRVFSLNKENFDPFKGIVDTMNKKSAEYYRKALEMAPDSSHINIRSALGFLNLPYPHRNIDLTRICLDKAVESAPNNAMAHHVFGKYYERTGENEQAKCSYEKAGQHGAFGAFMDLIRLEFRTDPHYNPIPLLEKVLDIFKEENNKCEVVCQMASYYYLKKNNLMKAVTCILEIVESYETVGAIKTHKPLCAPINKPFDILQVMIDESRLALKEEGISSEENAVYRKLISKFEGTDLIGNEPQAHRASLLEYKAKSQQFGRGRGRGQLRDHGNSYRQQGKQMGKERFELRCDEAKYTSWNKVNSHNANPHEHGSTSNYNGNREQFQRNRNVPAGNAGTNSENRNLNTNWRSRTQLTETSSHNPTSSTENGNKGTSVACRDDTTEENLKFGRN